MRRTNFIHFLRETRANMAIMMAVAAPVFVGVAGLSVETGYWYFLQGKAQTAADVSAYAGALALRNGDGDAKAKQAALIEAENLGYNILTAKVATNTPPTRGAYINSQAFEVIIDYSPPRFFSAVFNTTPNAHSVRAVASYMRPGKACVLALHEDAPSALNLWGSSTMTLRSCEMMANSVAIDAVSVGGSSTISVDCINSVGGYQENGGSTSVTLSTCNQPRTNLGRATDPYADVPAPDANRACKNLSNAGGPKKGLVTVSPDGDGVRRICNGMNLKGDYHFEPGVYIIDGTDFRLNANAVITGTDVTFYLTNGSELDFNGGAEINLIAPDTGDYAGLVFMGDPDDINSQHKLNGTADSSITGGIYLPAGDLVFAGDFSGLDGCMQLIASTIEVTGNTTIESDCESYGIRWAEVPGDVELVE